MSLQLGTQPDTLTVVLSRGADFVCTLVNEDEDGAELDWPAGIDITLRFNDPDTTEWAATVVGPEATFDVDEADVGVLTDSMTTSSHRKVSLFYVDGSFDFCWAKGRVVFNA